MAGPRDWVFRTRQQSLQGHKDKETRMATKKKLAKGKKASQVKSLSLRMEAVR
jgi:hypothetical protein